MPTYTCSIPNNTSISGTYKIATMAADEKIVSAHANEIKAKVTGGLQRNSYYYFSSAFYYTKAGTTTKMTAGISITQSTKQYAGSVLSITIPEGDGDFSAISDNTLGQDIYFRIYAKKSGATTITGINGYVSADSTISLTTQYITYSVSTSASSGGSLSSNVASARAGATVTLTPTANTGYIFSGYTSSPSVTITNNQFTMPSSNVTITANFTKINYNVTCQSNPSGAGTVSSNVSTAQYGDTVTLSQTPASGYAFSSWSSSPTVTITNDQFTMPASAVTITANYVVSNKLYFKNNGSWVEASAAYKKINGSWVEQDDLTTVFDSQTNYVKGN